MAENEEKVVSCRQARTMITRWLKGERCPVVVSTFDGALKHLEDCSKKECCELFATLEY